MVQYRLLHIRNRLLELELGEPIFQCIPKGGDWANCSVKFTELVLRSGLSSIILGKDALTVVSVSSEGSKEVFLDNDEKEVLGVVMAEGAVVMEEATEVALSVEKDQAVSLR